MNRPHPADAFAGNDDAPAMDLSSIVKQIEGLKPRALMPAQYDDVVTLIEYVRDEALKLYASAKELGAELDAREKDLVRRERDVETRSRALLAAIKTRETIPQRVRRYFGGNDAAQ